MLARILACLDVKDGAVVKGRRFQELRVVGDPVALARRYELEGADEIVLLDVSATLEGRATLLEIVLRTASHLFIPLTVGGGVRSVDDVARLLRSGADKVAINTAAVERPELLGEAARRFGSQCVVASIDAVRQGDRWIVYTHGGSRPTSLDALAWAERCASEGAGEILLTSIDRDGLRTGYDLQLTAQVVQLVSVPVIASGGAGSAEHLAEVLLRGGASGALVAGVLHDSEVTVGELKRFVKASGVAVRMPSTAGVG
jgi:cyclase